MSWRNVRNKFPKPKIFSLGAGPFYLFIAGILVALAASVFATGFVSKEDALKVSVGTINLVSFLLFFASLGAFAVSGLIQAAQDKWKTDGAEETEGAGLAYVRKRSVWLWIILFVSIASLVMAIIVALRSQAWH